MNARERIEFCLKRDGVPATVEFAQRMISAYKKMVLTTNGNRRTEYGTKHRRYVIEQCIVLRKFIRERSANV